MIKTVCMYCGRYHEKKGNLGEKDGISHGVCSRCLICKDNDGIPEADLRFDIIREISDRIVWQGEDKSNWPKKDVELYDRLYKEVKEELGEGGVDRR